MRIKIQNTGATRAVVPSQIHLELAPGEETEWLNSTCLDLKRISRIRVFKIVREALGARVPDPVISAPVEKPEISQPVEEPEVGLEEPTPVIEAPAAETEIVSSAPRKRGRPRKNRE